MPRLGRETVDKREGSACVRQRGDEAGQDGIQGGPLGVQSSDTLAPFPDLLLCRFVQPWVPNSDLNMPPATLIRTKALHVSCINSQKFPIRWGNRGIEKWVCFLESISRG